MTLDAKGFASLMEKLEQLGAVGSQKILAAAARRAMKPVLEAAKEKVAVRSGELRDSLSLATVKPKGSGDTVAAAGVKIGRRKVRDEVEGPALEGDSGPASISRTVDAGFRWHFEEFGTAHQAPRPYLRPAFLGNTQTVLELFKKELGKGIKRAIKKQLKGGGE